MSNKYEKSIVPSIFQKFDTLKHPNLCVGEGIYFRVQKEDSCGLYKEDFDREL